jgi:hypothetical protein
MISLTTDVAGGRPRAQRRLRRDGDGGNRVTTVYVASKAKHAAWWAALRAAGVTIISTWIDWPGNRDGAEPTADDWATHWQRCINETSAADVCLFVSQRGETACGALLEAGAALAAGKQVFVVSPDEWTFANHPNVQRFATLEQAIGAVSKFI